MRQRATLLLEREEELALNPPEAELRELPLLVTNATLIRVEALYHAFRLHHAKRVNPRWRDLAMRRVSIAPDMAEWAFVQYVIALNRRKLLLARLLDDQLKRLLPDGAEDHLVEIEVNGRIYAYHAVREMWVRYAWPADQVTRIRVAGSLS
jgi:hypothetical protein